MPFFWFPHLCSCGAKNANCLRSKTRFNRRRQITKPNVSNFNFGRIRNTLLLRRGSVWATSNPEKLSIRFLIQARTIRIRLRLLPRVKLDPLARGSKFFHSPLKRQITQRGIFKPLRLRGAILRPLPVRPRSPAKRRVRSRGARPRKLQAHRAQETKLFFNAHAERGPRIVGIFIPYELCR